MLNAFGSDSYSEWVGRKFTIIIIANIANITNIGNIGNIANIANIANISTMVIGHGHSESGPIWNIICKIADETDITALIKMNQQVSNNFSNNLSNFTHTNFTVKVRPPLLLILNLFYFSFEESY